MSRGVRIVVGVPNGLFCVVIHLAVELHAASEALITGGIVLVSLDVGEDSSEGLVAADYQNVLENVGVAALCWDTIWREVLNLV